MMQQTHTRMFTASEVAEFEYCPLVWWHEQFEPWVQAESEELFARLVELEHEQGAQAPALPEYRMIEQLLLRRGAFEQSSQQPPEHAEAVEEDTATIASALQQGTQAATRVYIFTRATLVLSVLAVFFLLLAVFWH
jgi:hypothetical protein